MLYLKIKSVIRLTGTRMKNPVDNREASVSGRCFWSQKGPDLGDLGLFITVSESYFFCALGTFSFLIPISGNMYKSSSSKSHILPKFLRKSRCTLVTCGGEVSITKVRCLWLTETKEWPLFCFLFVCLFWGGNKGGFDAVCVWFSVE